MGDLETNPSGAVPPQAAGYAAQGQTLARPTAGGWWWVRSSYCSEWHEHPVHVDIEAESVCFPDNVPTTYQDLDYLVEEGWVEWAGPLTPPARHTEKSSESGGRAPTNSQNANR